MPLSFSALREGMELPPLVRGPVTREEIRAYSEASGDPNPMHTDEEMARAAGYPGVFAQGMLVMAYLAQFLVKVGGVGCVRRMRARFAALTWPGDTLTCRGVVRRLAVEGGEQLVECDVHVEDAAGERKVVGNALLVLRQ